LGRTQHWSPGCYVSVPCHQRDRVNFRWRRADKLLLTVIFFAGSYGDGVFRSSDNGDNWIQVNNGLTALFVLSFATNASGDIFAGTYFGNGFLDQLTMETIGTKRTAG